MKTFPFHRSSVILMLFGLFHACAQLPDPEQLTNQVTEMIEPHAAKQLFSGVVLIGSGDSIIYHEAFGYADMAFESFNRMDTRFSIGSITKLFTSIITQQLVAERKIDLEHPVEKYISGFPKGPGNRVVKISHLLNHRSGIPHRVTGSDEELMWLSAKDIVEKVKDTTLLFRPGKERLYSSAGYTVLARVIEMAEEKPFDQVVSERIFDLAGMKSSISVAKYTIVEAGATSYFLRTRGGELALTAAPDKKLSYLTGAGSVYSTAEDLFKFRNALTKGVLGSELSEMEDMRNGVRWRGWTGRTNGFWSYLDVLPSTDLTLIILTNLGSASTWKLRAQLRNLLQGKATGTIDFPPSVAPAFENPESLIGQYENRGRVATITYLDGRLYRGENEFYPVANDRYYTLGSGSFLKFRRDKSGMVDALIQVRSDGETVFRRLK